MEREDYQKLHQRAKQLLRDYWDNLVDPSPAEKVDLILNQDGEEIPIDVQVRTSWKGDEFTYDHITLPEKMKQLRGWLVQFNVPLTRFLVLRNSDIRNLPVRGEYIFIPKSKATFYDVGIRVL